MTIHLPIIPMLVCAIFCFVVAKIRGTNPVIWAIIGFFFIYIAIPLVLFSKPDLSDEDQNHGSDDEEHF